MVRTLAESARARTPSLNLDGSWLATGTWRGTAGHVHDVTSGAVVREFPGLEMRLRFAPDDRTLTVSTRSEYRFHDVGTWALRFSYRRGREGQAGPVAFAPNGSLAVLARTPEELALVDLATGETRAHLPMPEGKRVTAIAFADESRLITTTPDREVYVWDLAALRADLRELGLDWGP